MASLPVTRASLVARALQRANTSGYADPLSEVPNLVDVSLAKLHNILAGEIFEDFYKKQMLIPLVQNQYIYQLPADFMKLRTLWYINPAPGTSPAMGARYLLDRIDDSQQTGQSTNNNYPGSAPYGYSFEANGLSISPAPGGPGPYNYLLMHYIPVYVPPLNDTTPIENVIAFGWDEWVVNDVVIQIRNKAMMPAQELVAERDNFMVNLRKQAKHRNQLTPPRVRNTGWRYGSNSNWGGGFSFRN